MGTQGSSISLVLEEMASEKEETAVNEVMRDMEEDEELHANCCGRDSIEEKRNRLDLRAGLLQNSIFLQ